MKFYFEQKLIDSKSESHGRVGTRFTWGEGTQEVYNGIVHHTEIREIKVYVDNIDKYIELGGKTDNSDIITEGVFGCDNFSHLHLYTGLYPLRVSKHFSSTCKFAGDYIYDAQIILDNSTKYTFQRILFANSPNGLTLIRTIHKTNRYSTPL